MHEGTTLSVAGSATFGGDLELKDGSKLKFGSLSANVTSVVVNAKCTVGGNVTVLLDTMPQAGAYPLIAALADPLSDDIESKWSVVVDGSANPRCSVSIRYGCVWLVVLPDDGASVWPAGWSGSDDGGIIRRFLVWKAANGVEADDLQQADEMAFLLGVAPGGNAALAVDAIEKGDGVVTLKANRSLLGVNGEVYVKYWSSLGSSPEDSVSVKGADVVDDGDGEDNGKLVTVRLCGEPPAEFYRLCVGYSVPETPQGGMETTQHQQ